MMKELKQLIIAILLIPLITLIFSRTCERVPLEIIERTDTLVISDTVFQKDTFIIEKPIPKYIEVLKIDTVFNEKGDTIQLVTENKIYNDTLCNQNDSIILQSSIRGINPTLDYIKADWRRQNITNTIEITKYIKTKPKRFTFNPQIGVGYGVFNKRPDVFFGVGISVNL